MEVSIAPEKIASIFSFPVTNSLLTSLITSTLLIIVAFIVSRRYQLIPVGIQNAFEAIIEPLYDFSAGIAGNKVKYFFPFVATFFLFIIVSNYLGLLPGVGTIGFKEHHDGLEVFVPLFRSANSDLNITLAMGLISVVVTHFFAIRFLGLKEYISKYISLNPIYLFVGLLEIIAEITKVLSLSLRLFGNIFSGEALLVTISSLAAFVIPLPFYFLEIIVGFVQATIFAVLTLVFMTMLSQSHHTEEVSH